MNALSAEELLAWVETTSTGWRNLAAAHPEILGFSCDVLDTHTVAGLLHHITVVELRYAQRIHGITETSYDAVSAETVDGIYTAHDQAMRLYREAIADRSVAWETAIEFKTRSAGTLLASRRTIMVHALMHSIRHYAQLATLVRQHGVKPGWGMDYLFMGARRP